MTLFEFWGAFFLSLVLYSSTEAVEAEQPSSSPDKSDKCSTETHPSLELEYLDTEGAIHKFKSDEGDFYDIEVPFEDFVNFGFSKEPHNGYKLNLTFDPVSGLSFLMESSGKTGIVTTGSMVMPTKYFYDCIQSPPVERGGVTACESDFRNRMDLLENSFLSILKKHFSDKKFLQLKDSLKHHRAFQSFFIDFYDALEAEDRATYRLSKVYRQAARAIERRRQRVSALSQLVNNLEAGPTDALYNCRR